MCQHCTTLQRFAPALARGEHIAFDSVRLALREIRAAHNYTVITRASRAQRPIADALRHVVAAIWRYIGTHSQANYNKIERSISAYFAAYQRANEKTKTRQINHAGKPEPIGSPRHFSVSPDCFIHDHKKTDPGAIIANVDHAQRAARNNIRAANGFMRAARRNENDGNLRAAALAHSFACDLISHANDIEETLAEYVSVYR